MFGRARRVVRGRSHALGQEPGNAPLDHLPLLGTASLLSMSYATGLGNDIWANTPDSIPFHLPTGVEYDKVLADVVERLVSIATQIAAEEAP